MSFRLDSKKRVFENYMRANTTHMEAKIFFRSAQKYVLDLYEFVQWATKEYGPFVSKDQFVHLADNDEYKRLAREDEFIDKSYSLYTPFKKVWMEFKRDEGHEMYIAAMPMASGKQVLGCGFDLDQNMAHYAVSDGDGNLFLSYTPLQRPELASPEEHMFRIRLAKVTQYLQTEFVDYETKSFKHGGKIRRGKLIQHISEYQMVYRKQPKKVTEDAGFGESEMDWQHRWHVRGHWRQVKGIGYDAEGNEMQGWTWIKAHIKGPEDKPLVEKTKIVRDSLPPQYKRA
jgi:hypothetical protein